MNSRPVQAPTTPPSSSSNTLSRTTRSCSIFVLLCLLASSIQIFVLSPISPDVLYLPSPSRSVSPTNHLLNVEKLGEGFVKHPEDVLVDKNGVLYTASREGWIKRMHPNGTWENWKFIGGDTVLGLAMSSSGHLIACDSDKGLLKISEDGWTVLASHVGGSKISFADDATEASDGSIYFSIPTTKFGLHNWFLDILEAKPHGRILKHDPSTQETSVLIDGLCFPNGIVISEDQHYLLVCETWKFRCFRYWLEGENKGKTDMFVENLPGAPDNINLAPDGTFWIALLQLIPERLEFLHSSRALKRLVAASPRLTKLVMGMYSKASVANVGADGKIIRIFNDPDGKVMTFVTSAFEHEDNLYLGGLNTNFIGKLPLKDAK